MAKAISYIRFSRQSQADNDSLRRQTEGTAIYCAEHGLELEEYSDLGKSAFHGKHAKFGALSRFLERLQPDHPNQIPTDTILIIEAMDRLSRAAPSEALPIFLDIINSGVSIVTLFDGQKYDKASIDANMGQLFLSVGLMFGAHMESKNKSKRVKESWIARRKRVTQMTPGWIYVQDNEYHVRPECKEVIKNIFEKCRDGIGFDRIAADLNRTGIPLFSKKKRKMEGWQAVYLRRLIKERTVLGEIQEHTLVDDKRVSTGKISKVYPAAVELSLYQAANDAIEGRRPAVGRKGTLFSNLLTGVARCECGAPMKIIKKVNPNGKVFHYLKCTMAKWEACKVDNKKYVPYFPREKIILAMWGEIAHGFDKPEPDELMKEIAAKRDEADQIEKSINALNDTVERSGQGAGIVTAKRLAALENSYSAALRAMEGLEKTIRQSVPSIHDEEALRTLIDNMDTLSGDALYDARCRINAGLRTYLDRIVFRADGDWEFVYKAGMTLPTSQAGLRMRVMRHIIEKPGDVPFVLKDGKVTLSSDFKVPI